MWSVSFPGLSPPPRGKDHHYPLYRLDGPKSQSGRHEEVTKLDSRKIVMILPRTTARYNFVWVKFTDWATPTYVYIDFIEYRVMKDMQVCGYFWYHWDIGANTHVELSRIWGSGSGASNSFDFWDIRPCSPMKVKQSFWMTCCSYLEGSRINSRVYLMLFSLFDLLFNPDDRGDMFFEKSVKQLYVVTS
jgi:hypothetical protein